ncbi:MAG: dihydroorotate dehydrogenase electron transfer subunit [Brevinematia bacterium]
MKFQENCKIISKRLNGEFLYLTLKTENIAKNSKPGQFVNIRVIDCYDPLLRRPFSISDVNGDLLKLVIQIKGKGTKILADKKEEESLNLLGPLGNSFPLDVKNPLFVAGGIGIAPFPFLARYFEKVILLYGIKSKDFLPDMSIIPHNVDVRIATEDGSLGERGTVVDLLVKHSFEDKTIFVCGPVPLFRALSKIFSRCENQISAYYLVESIMACGFGACKGCVIDTRDGYRLVCKDGPVFIWDEVRL